MLKTNTKIVGQSLSIINNHLESVEDIDRLQLAQSCLGVAVIMLEDVGEAKLASVLNTTSKMVHSLIEDEENK